MFGVLFKVCSHWQVADKVMSDLQLSADSMFLAQGVCVCVRACACAHVCVCTVFAFSPGEGYIPPPPSMVRVGFDFKSNVVICSVCVLCM